MPVFQHESKLRIRDLFETNAMILVVMLLQVRQPSRVGDENIHHGVCIKCNAIQ